MCLRFIFLLVTRVASWLRLSRREEAWQTAKILILRHQFAALARRQPRRQRLNWADRALLATLLAVIPKARRQGLRLRSPRTRSCAGTATSSAAGAPGPCAARPAGRDPPEHQDPGSPAGPREPRMGVPHERIAMVALPSHVALPAVGRGRREWISRILWPSEASQHVNRDCAILN